MGRRQLHLYFGDNGIFIEQLWDLVGGEAGVNIFTNELNSLTSFRQSYTYGQDGWLTIETYGRGENGASELRLWRRICRSSGGRSEANLRRAH